MNLYRGLFKLKRDFVLEVPMSVGECAYKLSEIQNVYTQFERGENGVVEYYLYHRFAVWIKSRFKLEAMILPIEKNKCAIHGTVNWENNLSARGLLFIYIPFVCAGLAGLLMFESVFAIFYILLPLAFWELNVIYRNKLLEMVKLTVEAEEIG